LQWNSARARWRLDGPAGAQTDSVVAALIDAGLTVECIAPATAYRVTGDVEPFREQVEGLAVELPPTGSIDLHGTVTPLRAYRRTVYVHGSGEAFRYVARAVDARLIVTAAGCCRWAVTGRTADLMVWLSEHVHRLPVEEVLALWSMTAELAGAEDVDLPPTPVMQITVPAPVVHITLPDRRTTSEITRDTRGDIVGIVQLEQDA
jgi:hypothetical protein